MNGSGHKENMDELMAVETVDTVVRRPWVKPSLQSISLNDALSSLNSGSDGPGGS